MKILAPAALASLALATLAAHAQTDNHWDKTYTVSAQPTLVLATGDSNLTIKSCGDCKTVRVTVDAQNRKLSDYHLEEDQSGNTIHFSLKERSHAGIRFSVKWRNNDSVAVQVETPANLTLHAETQDGNLDAAGLNGTISFRSSDGRQTIADVTGDLHVESSDGEIQLRNIAGTLDAHTSDGNLNISGKLDGLHVSTSDGKVDLELANGSNLKNDSVLHSSDGTVTVRLPKDLAVNLDVSTSDGKIDCDLPLALDGFHSNGGSDHSVRGKLNAGGALFTIRTSDATVHLSEL
jgi:DUF4097 and DUF4098 domain-containing protein YvlB